MSCWRDITFSRDPHSIALYEQRSRRYERRDVRTPTDFGSSLHRQRRRNHPDVLNPKSKLTSNFYWQLFNWQVSFEKLYKWQTQTASQSIKSIMLISSYCIDISDSCFWQFNIIIQVIKFHQKVKKCELCVLLIIIA